MADPFINLSMSQLFYFAAHGAVMLVLLVFWRSMRRKFLAIEIRMSRLRNQVHQLQQYQERLLLKELNRDTRTVPAQVPSQVPAQVPARVPVEDVSVAAPGYSSSKH
jgi:hypothetical protein